MSDFADEIERKLNELDRRVMLQLQAVQKQISLDQTEMVIDLLKQWKESLQK